MALAPVPSRTKVRQLAMKVQASPGVAVALAAADAIAIFNLKSEPLTPNNTEARQINSGTLSQLPDLPGITPWKISGSIEVRGSGDVATPTEPQIGKLLAAAGFAATLTPATGVDYSPASANLSLYTCGVYKDGIIETVMDCAVAKLSFKSTTKKRLLCDFEIHGRLVSIADGALLVGVDLGSTVPPQFANVALTLGAWSADNLNFETFQLDIENTVVVPTSANAADCFRPTMITDRKVTGQIDPELVKQAFYDIYGDIKAANALALSLTLGTVAGNKWTITAPAVQSSGYTDQDKSGIATVQLNLKLGMSAGDDEVKFAAR